MFGECLRRTAVWAIGVLGEVGRLVFAFTVFAEVKDLFFANDHGGVANVLGTVRGGLDNLVGAELA